MDDCTMSVSYDEIVSRAEWGFKGLANLFILSMMLMVALNALSRYLLNSAFTGVIEVIEQFLLPGIVFFSFGFLHRQKENIKLGLTKYIPTSVGMFVNVGSLVCMFLILLGVTRGSLTHAVEDTLELSTTMTGIPIYLSWWIVTIGLVYFLIVVVADLYELGVGLLRRLGLLATPSEGTEE